MGALSQLIQGELTNSGQVDPGTIADAVFAKLKPDDYPAAIQEMLRGYVRQTMLQRRHYRHQHAAPITPQGPSDRVAVLRETDWRRRLQDAFYCGDAGWKPLGAMTTDDLLYCAQQRREQAKRLEAWADRFESWAALLQEHKAATVQDLPDAVLERTLGRAA